MKNLYIILFFFLGYNFKASAYPIEKIQIWEGMGLSRSGIEISTSFKKGIFDLSIEARMRRIQVLEAKEIAQMEKERIAKEKEKNENYKRIVRESGEESAKVWLAKKSEEEKKIEEKKEQDREKSHFTFKTNTIMGKNSEGINLRSGREKQIKVSEKLKKQPINLPFRKEREYLIGFSDLLIEAADYEYVNNNIQNGDQLVTRANLILDVVMDLIPSISLVKDEISILTGVNPITAKGVAHLEKAIILGTIFFPLTSPVIKNNVSETATLLSKIIQNSPLRAENAKTLLRVITMSEKKLFLDFKQNQYVKKILNNYGELTDKVIGPSKALGGKTVEAINDMALTLIHNFSNDPSPLDKINELTLHLSALSNKLKLSSEAMNSMVEKQKTVPLEMMALAIKYGSKTQGSFSQEGFALYILEIFRKGEKYKLEVNYRETDNLIYHFSFKK